MLITITATLSVEEIEIISNLKGYAPTIPVGPGEPDIENPQSREDFVRSVYEAYIKKDATDIFLQYARNKRQEQERMEEETIRSNIDIAVSSKVE